MARRARKIPRKRDRMDDLERRVKKDRIGKARKKSKKYCNLKITKEPIYLK